MSEPKPPIPPTQASTEPDSPAPPGAAESRWEGLLPRLSLDRRITVLVLLASTLVVGVVAALGIPVELFPRGFESPFLSVNVPWSDAPAREVMDKIILPLEEELSTVRGLDGINSFSATGFGRVWMSFKHGTDMDVAYREVRDRIQRARARMPEDADRFFIRKDSPSGFPVAMIGLAIDPALVDPYDLIQSTIVLPLSRIDGVASVDLQGLEEKEVLIELDRQRTEAAGLNIYQIAQDLGSDNFSLASGSVYDGGAKLLLRSVARYGSLEEVENRRLSPSARVRDVATVSYAEPDKKYRVRVNGRPAVAVQVFKEGEANTLEVSRAVVELADELKLDPRLRLIELDVFFDQGSVIMESLGTLVDSGKIGALFAVGVLFFFLRRLRMTLIITLSIPLSMLIGLTVMYFAGESLNLLTLLGLMICVGLLVDNSVVVAENIYRMHKEGLPRREACLRGASQIALAITMATLTTVIVFLPVSLVDGEAQFFLLRLSIPVSVSLIASLLVALVFIPLSVYMTLPQNGNGHAPTRFERAHKRLNAVLHRAYDATFERVNEGYERLLGFFLVRRRHLIWGVTAVVAVTAGLAAARELEVVEQDENERPGFSIDVELPSNYSFEDTEEHFLEIERLLASMQEELDLDGYFFFHRTGWGEIEGWLRNPRTNDFPVRRINERLLEVLPERPGVTYYTGNEDESGEEDETEHVITLYGDDADLLEQTGAELEGVFAAADGVVGVKRLNQERQPNELALVVDRERAQRQQVNPQVVAGVVGYALRGQSLPEIHRDGREIQVRVRFEEEDRESLAELADFEVPTESGSLVSLASLTDVQVSSAAKGIMRRDKRMARTITLELEEGREDETRDRLEALTRRIDLPEGIGFGERPGRGRENNEDVAAMGFAAVVSVLFIYLLMGFLFESFILPLSIVATIPLAGIGVVWIHLFAGRDIDFLGMVGLVLLIGVVVNNGIVLIDYINRLRWEGKERREAVLLASRHRFRPIMMTALTTICGMVPLTIGGPTSIGLSYKSFGFTLIGGLTTATLLTLLVVPVLYTLFDDARDAFGAAVRRGWGRGRGGEAPAEALPPVQA